MPFVLPVPYGRLDLNPPMRDHPALGQTSLFLWRLVNSIVVSMVATMESAKRFFDKNKCFKLRKVGCRPWKHVQEDLHANNVSLKINVEAEESRSDSEN